MILISTYSEPAHPRNSQQRNPSLLPWRHRPVLYSADEQAAHESTELVHDWEFSDLVALVPASIESLAEVVTPGLSRGALSLEATPPRVELRHRTHRKSGASSQRFPTPHLTSSR